MNMFTRQHPNERFVVRGDACISISIPTHHTIPETAQDPIRFENVLRAVNQKLEQQVFISREIREQLDVAESRLQNTDF